MPWILLNNLIQNDFTLRVGEILADNKVTFDIETLDAMVRANYLDYVKLLIQYK